MFTGITRVLQRETREFDPSAHLARGITQKPANTQFWPVRFVDDLVEGPRLLFDEGENPQGASAPIHDLQGCGNNYGSDRWELIEVAQAGESQFTGAMHNIVIRKWRVKTARLSRIGADGFDAYTGHISIVGK